MSAPDGYRACPTCGSLVPVTAEFCPVCGSYLGWSAPADTAPPARPAPPPWPAQPSPGPATGAPGNPGFPAAAPPRVPGHPGPPRPQGVGTGPLRPAPVEPSPPAPVTDEPGAVHPARPVAPRPEVRTAAPEVIDNGVRCPRCGTINEPERRLCRHCGASLDGEPAAPAVRRRRRWRFGGSGVLVRRLVLLALLAVLVLAGIAFYPLGERLVQDVLDKTGTAEPVATEAVRAGAQVPGHPAEAAVDGVSNRYWGAPLPGSWIEATFGTPIRLVDVLVHTGASDEPGPFRAQARPVQVDLLITCADGTTHTVPTRLMDRPGEQRITTGISDVVRVRITEREIAGAAPGRHVALGELEFFRRG